MRRTLKKVIPICAAARANTSTSGWRRVTYNIEETKFVAKQRIAAKVTANSQEASRCAGSRDPPAAIAIVAKSKNAHPENPRFIRDLTVGPEPLVHEGKPQVSHI